MAARGLTVAFDGVPAIRGLDLEVAAGGFLCVVGPNGVGKTTLLRALAGLLEPAGGSCRVAGTSRLMFQDNDLFPWLTVRENLALARGSSSLDDAAWERETRRVLVEVGLAGREDAYPDALSGGARQRASLVRLFLSGADVLLMDEPFAHLDPTARVQLQDLLLRLWRETGRTIVMVTHDVHEAVLLAERVLVMQDVGRCQLFVVDEKRRHHPPGGVVGAVLAAIADAVPARAPSVPRGAGWSRAWVLSPLAVLCLWEVLVATGVLDRRFFPAPSAVAAELCALAASGALAAHVGASLLRLAAGMLIGGTLGVAGAVAMALSRTLRSVAEPLVAVAYPLPKIALLPMLLFVFGIGETSKVVTLAIGAFFLMLLPTLQGVEDVQRRYADSIRSLRLRGRDLYLRVLLRGALPSVTTGVRAAAGYCLVLLVAAEFTGTQRGVGFLIWRSWEVFDIEGMYAGLVVVAAAGLLLFLGSSRRSR